MPPGVASRPRAAAAAWRCRSTCRWAGWPVFAIGPLAQALPLPALALVAAAGACHALGVPSYALDKRLRWAHGVFHVLNGAHFAAVYGWVA